MAVTSADALANIAAQLDDIDHASRLLATAPEQLALIQTAQRVRDRMDALLLALVAEADAVEATQLAHGTSTTTWLADTQRLTRREAARLLRRASELSECPQVKQAALDGRVGSEQAAAITHTLATMPQELSSAEVARAEETMIGYAGQFDSQGLRRLSDHLVEAVAPELAERLESERVEREYQQATRDRYLSFTEFGGQR